MIVTRIGLYTSAAPVYGFSWSIICPDYRIFSMPLERQRSRENLKDYILVIITLSRLSYLSPTTPRRRMVERGRYSKQRSLYPRFIDIQDFTLTKVINSTLLI